MSISRKDEGKARGVVVLGFFFPAKREDAYFYKNLDEVVLDGRILFLKGC